MSQGHQAKCNDKRDELIACVQGFVLRCETGFLTVAGVKCRTPPKENMSSQLSSLKVLTKHFGCPDVALMKHGSSERSGAGSPRIPRVHRGGSHREDISRGWCDQE